jgi:ribosomal-protein-alanine N-acetyltransferase
MGYYGKRRMKMNPDTQSDSTEEYRIEDLDALYALTQQLEIIEFLPDWNVSKEQRLDWLLNYETVENKQFLVAVSEGGNIEQLRLRLSI